MLVGFDFRVGRNGVGSMCSGSDKLGGYVVRFDGLWWLRGVFEVFEWGRGDFL